MLKNLPRQYNPPGNGKRDMEKPIFADRAEIAMIKALFGPGKMTKHGIPSFSWRDDSGSDTNGTQDGNGGSSSNAGTSSDGGGNGGTGLTTGTVTGTKAFGPAGGMAVGMGAPGYGTPAEAAATMARLRPRAPIAPPVRPAMVPPPIAPIPIPRVKPPVPNPGFLGPNSPLAQASLPQIGGTNIADMMTAAINAGQPSTTPSANPGSSYGAPGGTSNPANTDTGGGGGDDTSANYGNDQFGSTFGTPSSPFGGGRTGFGGNAPASSPVSGPPDRGMMPNYGSGPAQDVDAPSPFGGGRTGFSGNAPTPTPPTVEQERVMRHLAMGKPIQAPAPMAPPRDPFSSYIRSPYENGPVQSPEQVVFKNYNKIPDRIPPSSAALSGRVWNGSGGLRSRSPDPSRRGY